MYDYVQKIKPVLLSANGIQKKAIILDCDNTLWGGIIGEDNFSGIKLGTKYPGNAFVEFQNHLLALHNRGIILAINSKNNPEDALKVLREHPDMVLREKNFGRANPAQAPKNGVWGRASVRKKLKARGEAQTGARIGRKQARRLRGAVSDPKLIRKNFPRKTPYS